MLPQKTMADLNAFLLVFILLYADDTIILAESAVYLQKCLDVFEVYCNRQLLVNLDKKKF